MHLTAKLVSRRIENGRGPHSGHIELTFSITFPVDPEKVGTSDLRRECSARVLREHNMGLYMTDAYRWSVSVDVDTSMKEALNISRGLGMDL